MLPVTALLPKDFSVSSTHIRCQKLTSLKAQAEGREEVPEPTADLAFTSRQTCGGSISIIPAGRNPTFYAQRSSIRKPPGVPPPAEVFPWSPAAPADCPHVAGRRRPGRRAVAG